MKFLLDLDGTLTDSRPGIIKCIQHALTALDVPTPSDAELTMLIGPPLQDTFSKLLPAPTAANVDRAVALYRQRFETDGMFENSVYPGIQKSLAGFHKSGVGLYLATSKPQVFAEKILEHFDLAQYFRGIYGSELDGSRGDKAELIRYILAREQINPKHATMIGDRAHDIAGGKANQLQTVGVLWGYGSRDELLAAGADMLIDRPDDFGWMFEFYAG
jgi:phosphoglycolate phosphatase